MSGKLIYWSFDPVLLTLGPLQIRYYGLIWAAAFLFGQQFLQFAHRREGLEQQETDRLLIHAIVGTIIGARLVHCLVYEPERYLSDPIAILQIWNGGLASHGGAVGLLLALWLYHRRHAMPSYLWMLDRIAIPAALGASMIRFANFLGSDIVGRPTAGDWGVVFQAVDALPRHPVQLYESAAYALIFALLAIVYLRQGARTPHGMLTGIFMSCVFLARFILEFFKMPQAEYEAGFAVSVGQWLSIPFFLLGIALVLHARARSRPGAAGQAGAPVTDKH